ncbi:MAG: alpha/beta hydrolase [Dehalococcoidia bacterium]|nr:alpha/beta hydrolase [Dehalococcoidia bacterium]
MPTVKVGDINIYYEVHGDGEPLLLIMGLGSDMTSWIFQIPEFSRKYQVIAFDNRGVGRSDAPDVPYSTAMMAGDTAGLLDALGVERAHIMGLSMGGMIAQELALRYPKRVKSLILAATAAIPYSWSTHVLGLRIRLAQEGVKQETLITLQLSWLFTDKFFDNPDIVRTVTDIMLSNPHSQPVHGYTRQFAACTEHDTRERIGKIIAPTLVLVGKEDMLLPVKMSEELAAGISNAELVVLEGGGHGFLIEIADKFNLAVLDFLAKL